ncbi:MAG TPA: PhoD-like phosphatase N-terminal domain-containing protein, partial [Gaiella sp.]|nr:PhoD-like phosphatase N-terminal domain-containing protein [Gaiella sp.]
MRLLVLAGVVVVSLAAGVSAGAKSGRPGFPLGVAAGEITSTSAKVWARAPQAGAVTLEVLPPNAGTRAVPILAFTIRAEASRDLTVQRTVVGLAPATRYRYRFHQGGVTSPTGSFTTAPRPNASVGVRFALTGDADATPGPNGKPGFHGFETYAAMARERNDFNVNVGDTIYSDS